MSYLFSTDMLPPPGPGFRDILRLMARTEAPHRPNPCVGYVFMGQRRGEDAWRSYTWEIATDKRAG